MHASDVCCVVGMHVARPHVVREWFWVSRGKDTYGCPSLSNWMKGRLGMIRFVVIVVCVLQLCPLEGHGLACLLTFSKHILKFKFCLPIESCMLTIAFEGLRTQFNCVCVCVSLFLSPPPLSLSSFFLPLSLLSFSLSSFFLSLSLSGLQVHLVWCTKVFLCRKMVPRTLLLSRPSKAKVRMTVDRHAMWGACGWNHRAGQSGSERELLLGGCSLWIVVGGNVWLLFILLISWMLLLCAWFSTKSDVSPRSSSQQGVNLPMSQTSSTSTL